tara:strand:+ start:38104 stop:38637 length:534 start_codon:yes stop_codon:yes gene_type:complete
MKGWTKFGLVLCVIGYGVTIIMMLAGFMRLTMENQKYTSTECVVKNKETRENKGVCIAGKCAPSTYEGLVEFQISDGTEHWVEVIKSYTKKIVDDFMTSHFTLNTETKCYISNSGEVRFQLHGTVAILVISIIIFVVTTLIAVLCCFSDFKKKRQYIDLDKDSKQVIDNDIFGNRGL